MIGQFSLSGIQAPLRGTLIGKDCSFDGVSTDSRTITPGQLFVALKGENFDAGDFVSEAAKKGACAAVVSRPVELDIPRLQVEDTLLALGQLGSLNRSRSQAGIAAVTGSQGKTTVKEMLGAILAEAGETWVTRGNLNNAIGVPLSLLGLEQQHRFAVIELGANAVGEIAYSVALVKPHVAVLTNATPTHLEGFGSLAGVVQGKGEIVEGLAEDGVAVLNADDPHYLNWVNRAGRRRTVSFGCRNAEAQFRAIDPVIGKTGQVQFELRTPQGSRMASLKLLGRHNAINAAAAAAAAVQMGVSLEAVISGLARVRAVKGRMCLMTGREGATVIDDSYNASPSSFKAAIDLLAEFEGERLLIMGDMAEMGNESASAHTEVGEYARQRKINRLWATGNLSRLAVNAFGSGGRLFSDQEALIGACQDILGDSTTLLIKGSRSASMDKVADRLTIKEASPC